MINLNGSLCEVQDCKNEASFGYEEDGKNLRCSLHKDPKMIDITNPKCLVCGKTGKFGLLGNKPIHCAVHTDKRI